MVTVCALDLQFKGVPTSVCYNIVEYSPLTVMLDAKGETLGECLGLNKHQILE